MPKSPPSPVDRSQVWLALGILYIVWGSTYLGIAIAVDTIPPFLMAALRFGLAGSVLLGWTILRAGRAFAWPTRRQWRDTAIVGSLLLGGGMGMVAYGEQTIPSGITALLIAMMPVWVAIFGRVFLGQHLPGLAVLGVVIGFVGVAVLAGPTALGEAGALDPLGLVAIIISPIAWAIGSLYASHRAILPGQPLVSTGAQMITGAVTLTVMAALTGEFDRFDPATISGASLAAFFYLTIIGSLVAFTAYGWLLRTAPLPLIATYAYVNPVVAVVLGAVVLREAIEPRTLVAGAVIVAAVALIITARSRMTSPTPRRVGAPATARPAPTVPPGSTATWTCAPSPGPATARSAAAGPPGSPGHSRPG